MNVSANIRSDDRYVVGVDFGTLSGRALVVRGVWCSRAVLSERGPMVPQTAHDSAGARRVAVP